MTITPPGIKISGNKQRAEDLGSRAKKFYNFVANQATLGGVNLSRTQVCNDGSIIQVTSYLDKNTGLRTGTVRIIGAGKPIPKKKKKPSKFFIALTSAYLGASARSWYQLQNNQSFTYIGNVANKDMIAYYSNPSHYYWEDTYTYQSSSDKFDITQDLFDKSCMTYSYDSAGIPIHWNGPVKIDWGLDYYTQKRMSGNQIVYKGRKYQYYGNPITDRMMDVVVVGTWLYVLWTYSWGGSMYIMLSVKDTATALDLPNINYLDDLWDSCYLQWIAAPTKSYKFYCNAFTSTELNTASASSVTFYQPFPWFERDGSKFTIPALIWNHTTNIFTMWKLEVPLVQDPGSSSPTINNLIMGTPTVTSMGNAYQNARKRYVNNVSVTQDINETIPYIDPGGPNLGWFDGYFKIKKREGKATAYFEVDPSNYPATGVWLGGFYQDTPGHAEFGKLKQLYAYYNKLDPDLGEFKYEDDVSIWTDATFQHSWPGNDSVSEAKLTQYMGDIESYVRGRWTITSGTKAHVFPGIYDDTGKRYAIIEWYNLRCPNTGTQNERNLHSSWTTGSLVSEGTPPNDFTWHHYMFNESHTGTTKITGITTGTSPASEQAWTDSTYFPSNTSTVMAWPGAYNLKERTHITTYASWSGSLKWPTDTNVVLDVDHTSDRGDHSTVTVFKYLKPDMYQYVLYADDKAYNLKKFHCDSTRTDQTQSIPEWRDIYGFWSPDPTCWQGPDGAAGVPGYTYSTNYPIYLDGTEMAPSAVVKLDDTHYLFSFCHRINWFNNPPSPSTGLDREIYEGILDTSTGLVTWIDSWPSPKGITGWFNDSRLAGAMICPSYCSIYT